MNRLNQTRSRVDAASHGSLVAAWQKSPDTEMTVDLEKQRVVFAGLDIPFTGNSFSRTCLLEGLDELGYILRHEEQIAAFETARQ